VPRLLIPDNAKVAVIKACRYEPQINRTYAEMAAHYGTAVLPTRPHRPRDKAKVEVGVLVVERWILARLRHRRFTSLAELNAAIAELLRRLNEEKPLRRLGCTRRQLLEELDRPALKPLPIEPYVFAQWRVCRVGIDYHVEVEKHFYSVPHRLARAEVEVRLAGRSVEIFAKGERIAVHQRSSGNGKHTTITDHMPSSHRRYADWTIARIRRDAALIGPATAALCDLILEHRPHPEQGFRSCLGILRLARPFGVAGSKLPPPAPSGSARSPMVRFAPSSTTSSIGMPHISAPRTARRSCIPTSAARAITIRRSDLADPSNSRSVASAQPCRHGQSLRRDPSLRRSHRADPPRMARTIARSRGQLSARPAPARQAALRQAAPSGRQSTIITSQIPVDKWHELIGEPTYADAILDRIVHNAHRINLTGHSLRRSRTNKPAKD
jgi:transposase